MTDHRLRPGPRPDGTVELVIELRHATRRAQALLQDAMETGRGELVVRLDEASQASTGPWWPSKAEAWPRRLSGI